MTIVHILSVNPSSIAGVTLNRFAAQYTPQMDKNFTLEEVKSALLAIRDKVTDAQLRMLKAHYSCRTASMEQIAKLGGYGENYRTENLQYGVLCGRIAQQLGFTPEGNKTSTIASVSSEPDDKGHFQWHMDDVIAAALEELGWVRRDIVQH